MQNAEGNITMWIGSNTDIHDMVNVREELRGAQAQLADRAIHLEGIVANRTEELMAAHAQLLAEADERRRLESEIAGAIEGERERMGQELHDGLVQELTGIAMMLYVMERKLLKPAPEQAAEAHRLSLMLQQSHRNARDLAKSFYPIELEQQGLAAALEGIAQRAQEQSGVKCTMEAGTIVETGAKDATSVQLLRIAQEAVQNAVKHAHARKIVIHLSKPEGSWLLTVRDDGTGLGHHLRKKAGMGMCIMQYRARIIKGNLSVGNAAGGGVLVSCSAPSGEPR
jgi:signal transduction histidine kinase